LVPGDPDAIPAIRELIEEKLVAAPAAMLEGADPRLRAELAGALIVGLFICRHMLYLEPLASASVDRIVTLLKGPLDGILGRPPVGGGRRPSR
jgi:hypothetical protein